MIPEGESALAFDLSEDGHRVIDQELVGILEEDGIGMPRRHVSGDLGPIQDDEICVADRFDGDLIRPVSIGMRDVVFMGLIFEVVRYCNGIEPITKRFLHPDVGPDAAVGKHGVQVEIALQRLISRDVGELDASFGGVRVLGMRRRRNEQGKQEKNQELFHGCQGEEFSVFGTSRSPHKRHERSELVLTHKLAALAPEG